MRTGRFQVDREARKELLTHVEKHKEECDPTPYHEKSCVHEISRDVDKTTQAIYRMLKRMKVKAPGPGSGGYRHGTRRV